MMRINLFTGFLCIVIYFLHPVKCTGQTKINLPSYLENADTIIGMPVKRVNMDSFRLFSQDSMPLPVFKRMEQIYFSFEHPANYSFLGFGIEKIQMSLDKDSTIVTLNFIIPYTDDLLPAALKKFGNESGKWTAISPLALPDDPIPYSHHWGIGQHHLSFQDLLTTEDIRAGNFRITQNKKIVISFKKSLDDYYKD